MASRNVPAACRLRAWRRPDSRAEGAEGRGDNGDADVILLVAVLAPVPQRVILIFWQRPCQKTLLASTSSTSPLALPIFCDTHAAVPFCQMAKGFEQVLQSITQKQKARN